MSYLCSAIRNEARLRALLNTFHKPMKHVSLPCETRLAKAKFKINKFKIQKQLLTINTRYPLRGIQNSSSSGEVGRGLFHMYPDKDTPGERLFLQLQKVLPSLVHHQLPLGCKDYSEYYLKVKN